jgi:hypothetical protein
MKLLISKLIVVAPRVESLGRQYLDDDDVRERKHG